jgi:hypothetical protein
MDTQTVHRGYSRSGDIYYEHSLQEVSKLAKFQEKVIQHTQARTIIQSSKPNIWRDNRTKHLNANAMVDTPKKTKLTMTMTTALSSNFGDIAA